MFFVAWGARPGSQASHIQSMQYEQIFSPLDCPSGLSPCPSASWEPQLFGRWVFWSDWKSPQSCRHTTPLPRHSAGLLHLFLLSDLRHLAHCTLDLGWFHRWSPPSLHDSIPRASSSPRTVTWVALLDLAANLHSFPSCKRSWSAGPCTCQNPFWTYRIGLDSPGLSSTKGMDFAGRTSTTWQCQTGFSALPRSAEDNDTAFGIESEWATGVCAGKPSTATLVLSMSLWEMEAKALGLAFAGWS